MIGSSGGFPPLALSGVDGTSGVVAWQDRGFTRAQSFHADGKLILLDEEGTLGLATVIPAGLQLLARSGFSSRLLERRRH